MEAEGKQSCDSLSMSSPSSPPEYAPLRNKDMDSVDGLDMLPLHRIKRKRGRVFGIFKLLGAMVILAFIVLTFALSFHAVDLLGKIGHLIKEIKPSASHQRSYKYPCGETAAEAKAKGCIFDVMSMTWQSPECYDPDLAMEFADLGPWEFYTDSSGAEKMSLEQISREGQISWTTRRYFVQHCIFGWKAMHRAWQRGWRMDSNLASIEHTELCSRVFANTSIPLDALTTRIHVDFPSCN
jgi:hypothetical protein